MNVEGKPYRTIWLDEDGWRVRVIDQTRLPFAFTDVALDSVAAAAHAIRTMVVRGAPLIGATAAYGMALAMHADPSDGNLEAAATQLGATRPTAVNLMWALGSMRAHLQGLAPPAQRAAAYAHAAKICNDNVSQCRAIGEHGRAVIERLAEAKQRPLNILTHCNAGWLACVDWGTALAPIYRAHDAGVKLHVWVDETRPRNQGAALTAFELGAHGVPHTVIADNAGGHLMQRGQVDMVIVGSDRTTATGDVCNKIGTYLKALAAAAHNVPFYVALPSTTIDWHLNDGAAIPIEERDAREITHIAGRGEDGTVTTVQLVPDGARAFNIAFDVTPARYVTGLITERGVCPASRDGIAGLFPDNAVAAQ